MMEKTSADPDLYIASLIEAFRDDIALLDAEIRRQMPERSRVLYTGKFWGGTDQNIIGYGDVTYTNSKREKVEWFIVGLAAQKNYISLYVNATDADGYLVAKYTGRLGKAKVRSAAITFKSVKEIDLEALVDLISRANQAVD
jgi:hypothetical protein